MAACMSEPEALDFPPDAAELWGFKRGQVAEVLDGRTWVRCIVLCLDDAKGEPGAIVRTMERPGSRRLLYVRAAHCIRVPELNEAEAFRERERARVAVIEARQARERRGVRA